VLGIDEGGAVGLRLGDGMGGVAEVSAGKPLLVCNPSKPTW